MFADRGGQRQSHDVLPRHRAGIGGVDDLAPPLQANLAKHRLGHDLSHAGDLVVEGKQREEGAAPLGRGKQHGLVAVAVVPA